MSTTLQAVDVTEAPRRARIAELNVTAADKQELGRRHGTTWDPKELAEQFEVVGIMAPLVVVRRKADDVVGSMEFQHCPRFYFNWREDDAKGGRQ